MRFEPARKIRVAVRVWHLITVGVQLPQPRAPEGCDRIVGTGSCTLPMTFKQLRDLSARYVPALHPGVTAVGATDSPQQSDGLVQRGPAR